MCLDHPTVQELVGKIEDRRVFTYGENPQADIRLLDVDTSGGVTRFAVLIRERATGRATYIDDLALPMPGRHNALNATAAIAVAHQLGAPVDVIRKAIGAFGGVKRRFTRTGDMERRRHLRRLRPPPGRDRRGAQGRARRDRPAR